LIAKDPVGRYFGMGEAQAFGLEIFRQIKV
jgi:hypothetical protein